MLTLERPDQVQAAFTTFAATDLLLNRDNALADFNQAIQLNPKMAEAYVVRGDISHLKGGNLADAFPDYDQAIQLNPELGEAYYGRSTVCFLKGDLDNALADFNQAIQLNPKMAENLHQMTGVVQNHTEGN
jgi:tetratricopeptide (TPR) repeat protein